MQRLYVMALYATRPAEEPAESLAHEVSLRVAMTVAASDEEARQKGFNQLREWCPPIDGWMNHHITLNIVPKESLKSLMETVSDDPPEDDESETVEWPEVIM